MLSIFFSLKIMHRLFLPLKIEENPDEYLMSFDTFELKELKAKETKRMGKKMFTFFHFLSLISFDYSIM